MGCHFLLQCMKVKSESEVAQSCPTLSDPMDCSLPSSSVHGIFQARVLEWGAIAFSGNRHWKRPNAFGQIKPIMGFPGGSDGKESACNEGDPGLIPGLDFPGERNDNPVQYSCLENSMDRGAWCAVVHGVSHFHFTFSPE